MSFLIALALLLVGFIVVKKISKGSSASLLGGSSTPITQVLSHWGQLMPFFSMSAQDFYTKVEESIQEHEMPYVRLERVNQKEGGLLSASREYLRIRRGDLIFEVCAAPFGKDFFVSWWLYQTEGAARQIFKHTKVGTFLNNRAGNKTFYQADIEGMFRSCSHQCILEVVDRMTEQTGKRLSDIERQPIEGGF